MTDQSSSVYKNYTFFKEKNQCKDYHIHLESLDINEFSYIRYIFSLHKFEFKKEIFLNAPDFVKSAESFGAAASASKLVFVSQKAYRFIKDNKLDSSLVFEPIQLV